MNCGRRRLSLYCRRSSMEALEPMSKLASNALAKYQVDRKLELIKKWWKCSNEKHKGGHGFIGECIECLLMLMALEHSIRLAEREYVRWLIVAAVEKQGHDRISLDLIREMDFTLVADFVERP